MGSHNTGSTLYPCSLSRSLVRNSRELHTTSKKFCKRLRYGGASVSPKISPGGGGGVGGGIMMSVSLGCCDVF